LLKYKVIHTFNQVITKSGLAMVKENSSGNQYWLFIETLGSDPTLGCLSWHKRSLATCI